MNEPKTHCTACGAPIQQITAEQHRGLCVPCFREITAIPPDDYEIPNDLAERIVSIGLTPADFRQTAWKEGVSWVHGFLDKVAQAEDLYATWAPRLRAFAAACRASNPSPTRQSLSTRELAQLPIYESKIRKDGDPLRHNRKEVLICSVPLLAIPVAHELWPGKDDRCVLLTPEELSQWNEQYEHPEDAFWWFIRYWWRIEAPPKPGGIWTHDTELTVPDGAEPWLVVSGMICGDLAGGEGAELWAWDGEEARFIENIGCATF